MTLQHLRLRRADDRPRTRLDWLDSRHTFSFGHHFDPEWMGHSGLRVLNQDVVAAGGGFDWHSHRDMEIVSYVLSGALRHQDSMGTDHTIRPGQVQRMSAGTGVTHREWNAADGPTEFLQMWVVPTKKGLEPSYDQKEFDLDGDRFVRVAGPQGPVVLHADAGLHAVRAPTGASLQHSIEGTAWLHVAKGRVQTAVASVAEAHALPARANMGETADLLLGQGDGVGVDGQGLRIEVVDAAELVLWSLPARQDD